MDFEGQVKRTLAYISVSETIPRRTRNLLKLADHDGRERRYRPREQRNDGVEGDDEEAEDDGCEERRPLSTGGRPPDPDDTDHQQDDPGYEQLKVRLEELAVGGDEPEPFDDDK